MSTEEQRLARLLKRVVPEPPIQLSADQITTASARQSARSWTLPALAAAAVVAIGVTVGVVATQLPSKGGAAAPQTVSGTTAGNASPQPVATCHGRTVTVPNVVGTEQGAALAIIQDAGLNGGIYFGQAPASAHVAPGLVFAQSPAAGSKAVPGALVRLSIASAPSTSTADPGSAPTATPTSASPCLSVVGTPAPSNASVPVPNVVGMTANQARDVARAAGFSVSVVTSAARGSRAAAPGTVFAQSPAAGSRAMPRTGMILDVAAAG
jgi:hypothetical protein